MRGALTVYDEEAGVFYGIDTPPARALARRRRDEAVRRRVADASGAKVQGLSDPHRDQGTDLAPPDEPPARP